MFRFFFGVHLRRSITWELLSRCVADCPPWGYRVARQTPLFEFRLCLSVCIVPVTVLPSSIYPILTSAIPKMFLSVCQPDLAFVGNAGHLAAVIDLAGSGSLAGPRVNYCIGPPLFEQRQLICRSSGVDCRIHVSSGCLAAKHISCWRLFFGKKLASLDALIFICRQGTYGDDNVLLFMFECEQDDLKFLYSILQVARVFSFPAVCRFPSNMSSAMFLVCIQTVIRVGVVRFCVSIVHRHVCQCRQRIEAR